ncbi:10868_t:CDS:1, partial [Funneliformis geosporum]
IQNKAKEELRCQFKELIDSNSALPISSPNSLNQSNFSHKNRLHSSIFSVITANSNSFYELECYLDPT